MNELLTAALALAAGLALGGIFFGALWWTVRRGMAARQPAPWFLGSALLRMGIVLAGFYLVGHEHWQRLVWCLLGFVAARLMVRRLTRPQAATPTARAQVAGHAP